MTASRDAILLEILREHKDRHLTVTSVRTEILRRDKTVKLDKAALRRWANRKFATLVRRGLLEKHVDERGKGRFLVLDKGDERFSQVLLRPLRTPKQDCNSCENPSRVYDQLKKELDEHRLRAISQLSEIEEYKRISETFPDLRAIAGEKFEEALDENCRVLGKIRALEQLLMRRESS